MKKIAIMTWYKYRNFGTALQCTALFSKIKALGYEPTLISYDTSARKYLFPERETTLKSAKAFINRRLKKSSYVSKEKERLFSEYLSRRVNETELCTNYSELYALNSQFDAFVCGSDQVWTPTSFDDKNYLSFVDENKPKIAYAPSFGAVKISNEYQKPVIRGLLSRVDSISVREKQGAELVNELIGKKPPVVLDPTLLLDSSEWDSYAETDSCRKIEGKYILCYFLGDEKKYLKNVKKISQKLKIPYYVIPVMKKQQGNDRKVPFEVGPSEFVSLVKNAEYVCTDSFHGMAFAVNYNIPFSVYKRFSDNDPFAQNSRVYNLLDLLSLRERLGDDSYLKTMDYKGANEKLAEAREMSLSYLRNALAIEKKEKINYLTGSLCCGCTACENACPTKAISVRECESGFYRYSIDKDLCVNCGKCKSVCPVLNKPASEIKNSDGLYAFSHEDDKVLGVSSSGGAAYAISQLMLGRNALVCGCEYDAESSRARHIIIDNEDELFRLQGSKYMQSDVGDCFGRLVSENRPFVFFGTPCQTAGLDNLLRRAGKRDNALLVDLICHGVPSLHLWDKYLSEQKKKNKLSDTVDCKFRDKNYGWQEKYITLTSGGKALSCSEEKDDYYAFFKRAVAYMPTCYECRFRENTSADIRIGDFWGAKYSENKKGVSMVVAVTEKGADTVNALSGSHKQKYDLKQYSGSQYVKNPQKPIYYMQALLDSKDESVSLKEMKKRYCSVYEKRERTQRLKKRLKPVVKLIKR